MKNLEIKAFCADLKRAENIALSIGAKKIWEHEQRDTYFKVHKGKLKLRQVDGEIAELIFYERPPIKESKISSYSIYRTTNADELSALMAKFLDIDLVVLKTRTLYLWSNVRIHLDRVNNLSTFIEFEAVLDGEKDVKASQARIQFLMDSFSIRQNDLLSKGYCELSSELFKNNRE
ncbi:class IV adenylate cyclase [candidate division KSB1 bacterium]|nr:class IV adenylate cyclase [candidate division KSB1 bacterium]